MSSRQQRQALYTHEWREAREDWLRAHPLCAMHRKLGRIVAASVVDHKVPHRGDPALFWDRNNWQSLCKHCHDAHKQSEERSGSERGCDVEGIPFDAGHHWHTSSATSTSD